MPTAQNNDYDFLQYHNYPDRTFHAFYAVHCGHYDYSFAVPLTILTVIQFSAAPLLGLLFIGALGMNRNAKLAIVFFCHGGKVVSEVLEGITDEEYLKFASNIATCHHEKWDGSGYPFGKKGEEIPLSARIMAVADVFDALISKRCYKEAMSFDQAVEIIRQGAGTHFDPKLVEVFLKHQEDFC